MCAEGCHACLQFALVHVASKSTINNMHARMHGLEEPPEAPVGALVLSSTGECSGSSGIALVLRYKR